MGEPNAMSEKSYTAGDKKINLKPVEDIIVVKYNKDIDRKRALDIISTTKESNFEQSHVETYPSFNLSLVTRPPGDTESSKLKFSRSLVEDKDVEFVSPAYKDKDTGWLVVITNQLNVGFKEGVNKEAIDAILSENDLSIMEQSKFSPQEYILKINTADSSDKTLEVYDKLTSRKEIEYVDPVTLTEIKKASVQEPVGKYFVEQWHLNNKGQGGGTPHEDVKALEAWQITKGDPNIKVACIDDGLAYSHVDIIDNAWRNSDPSGSGEYGYNFYDNVANPQPIYFKPPFDDTNTNDIHGTPCAGVICGSGKHEGVYGIAPLCSIIGVKIFGGANLAPPFRIAEAIRYAGRYADTLSCSWGIGVNDTVIQAIKNVTGSGRNGKGCPVFVATGNDFASSISFPANMAETIAVGASTNEGRRASYSNYGPGIDFLAPSNGGTKGIFTTDVPYENRGYNLGKPGQGDPEGLYTNSFGGTSSATPLAAGIGALLLSINKNLTAQDIRKILRVSCEKIDPDKAQYDENGLSATHGYGRVNARRALELAKSLLPTSALRSGSRGPEVTLLQEILKSKGFDPGAIDGKFGPKTEAAVRKFQGARGLAVDGIVGPKTWKALLNLNND